MERITITRRLNSIKNDFFKALLSREDFKAKLELLRQADPSEFHTVCASLCDMLDAVEIEYDKNRVSYLCELILDGKLSEYRKTKDHCISYFESIIQEADLPKALFFKADFEVALESLKQADSSEFLMACTSLCEMFDAVGIEYDKSKIVSLRDLSLDEMLSKYEKTKKEYIAYFEKIVENVDSPKSIALDVKMLNILFEKFSDYPEPSEYMKRIVDRCSNPDDGWEKDSLRLRILKQFIKYGNCLVYQTECDGKSKKTSVYGWEKIILAYAKKKGAKKLSALSEAIPFVDEEIFETYDKTIKELQKTLCEVRYSERLNICQQMAKELKQQISELKKMKKSIKENDELLNVEEQLKKAQLQLNEVQVQLEEVKQLRKKKQKLINNTKQKLKDEKKKFGLIRLADDLASGKFTAAGVTKRDLYLFAVVFDMTYYCPNETGNSETLERYDTDIEKNLFTDYYTNNLMRFLTKAYQGRLSGVEVDPSGQGINYKNFAEMVFIYYIAKDIAPIDKITGIYDMLARLENSSQNHMKAKSFGTAFYRSIFTEDILKLSETDFEDFIKSNYDCTLTDENGKKLNKSEFQLMTTQNTAFAAYCKILEDLSKLEYPMRRENCNYGLWMVDISMLNKSQNKNLTDVITGEAEKIDKFITLLKGINSFVGIEFTEAESSKYTLVEEDEPSRRLHPIMDIQDPEDITRTAIVVAYYYYYNTRNSCIGVKKNLQEVYNDYTNNITGLNAILLEAHMQPISDKNIFDLVVIFSSYAYLMN